MQRLLMQRLLGPLIISLLCGILFCGGMAQAAPLTFETSDHVTVFADYVPGKDLQKPLILMFHQAGSNGAEYQSIARHGQKLGYATLQVDQRSGGHLYGRDNATVQHLGRSTSYLEALPDLEAAVNFATQQGHKGPLVAMGSSYSASLIFLLAARDQRVSALIAFSPGEYFSDPTLVHKAAMSFHQPTLVASASSQSEQEAAGSILASTSSEIRLQLKPKQASHGAAALSGDTGDEIWPAIEAFVMRLTKR